GSATTLDVTLVTAHSQGLSGLVPATLYHYRVKSRDAAGNLAVSGDFTLTTAAPPVQAPYYGQPFAVRGTFEAEDFDLGGEGLAYHDVVPGNHGGLDRTTEDVDIVSPYAGGYVINNIQTGEWLEYTISVAQAGVYRLEALASSALTGSRWRMEIDGVNVTGPVTVPNTGAWNTFQWTGVGGVSLAAGTHVLRFHSEVEYFNLDALRTVLTDTTPPNVSVTAPLTGQTVSGTITVSASASDNVGVVGVQIKLDGANLGA